MAICLDFRECYAIELCTTSNNEIVPIRPSANFPVTPLRYVRRRLLPANVVANGVILSEFMQRAAACTCARTQRVGWLPRGRFPVSARSTARRVGATTPARSRDRDAKY